MSETSPAGLDEVLSTPTLAALLESARPARLAWIAADGTPRIAPMWFTWIDGEIVVSTFAGMAKLAQLTVDTPVAVCIDTEDFPPRAITMRGRISAQEPVTGLTPEYEAAAVRYAGSRVGPAWCAALAGANQVRLRVRPDIVQSSDLGAQSDFFRTPIPAH